MLEGHEKEVTQDFLLSSGRCFAVADLEGFLRVQRFLEGVSALPEGVKQAGTAVGGQQIRRCISLDPEARSWISSDILILTP
jgi:hypothetical protein